MTGLKEAHVARSGCAGISPGMPPSCMACAKNSPTCSSAAPEAMAPVWPESSEWRGPSARAAATTKMRYVSRLRADVEPDEHLLREVMPRPTLLPSLKAKREASVCGSCQLAGRSAGATAVALERLFEPGVYAKLQQSIRER